MRNLLSGDNTQFFTFHYFPFVLLHWLVPSPSVPLCLTAGCGWGQLRGKGPWVPWDGASMSRGCLLLCCWVNLFLLGPSSSALPAWEAAGNPAAPLAAVSPRLPERSIETLEGSHKCDAIRSEKRTSKGVQLWRTAGSSGQREPEEGV